MKPPIDPDEVSWLAGLALEKFKPLSIEIDHQDKFVALRGNAQEYGFREPLPGLPATDYFDFLAGLETQEDHELEFVETPNGRSVHVLLHRSAQNRILVLTDASLERDQRQALQQKSHELKLLADRQADLLDELSLLNSALEKKKQEAEKLTQMQSQFLASMSHEFRTPLASILAYAEYMGKSNARINMHDGLSAIDRSAKHLLNLVENLISHAQFSLEGIKLNTEPVNVRQLCDELESLFRPIAVGKGLDIYVSCALSVPEYLRLDAMRIRQMIINLMGNACKYTQKGSVSLSLSWWDDSLEIEINDTGAGIANNMLETIFAPFERGSASDSQGAGLGLHITQRLVDLMEGSITVDSELGRGTSISMGVPAAVAEHGLSEETPRPDQNILVIEDDSDVYDILEIYLDEAGYTVFHADSGLSAIEMFDHIEPDAIVTDLNVPDLDGVGVTERLRARGFSGPIIILTASALKQNREKAEAAGCSAYLVKPVSPSELIVHLNQVGSWSAKRGLENSSERNKR